MNNLKVGEERDGVEVCVKCGRALLYTEYTPEYRVYLEENYCVDCLKGNEVSREITKIGVELGEKYYKN